MRLDNGLRRIKTISGKKIFWAFLLTAQLLVLLLFLWLNATGMYTLPIYIIVCCALLTVLLQWLYLYPPAESMDNSLLETIPDGFIQLDRRGKIIHLNRRAYQLLGTGGVVQVNQPIGTLFPKEDFPLFDEALQLVLAGKKVEELTMYLLSQQCWFAVQLTPSARGVNVYFRDITAVKNQASLLQLFESVITKSADSILITSAEPIHQPGPEIVYVNDAFTRMTGYLPEEVIGLTPRILQGPETSRKELDRLKEALTQWKPVEVELVNYKKNKEEFWVSISVVPVCDEKGWFTHWISIQRDITDRKREEALLKGKNQDLKNLSDYLQNMREKERKHIAREIHEELGQLTTVLKMDIDWLSIRLAGGEDAVLKRLGNATSTLAIMLAYIHRIAAKLRPSILDHFGLTVALEAHCSEFQRQNGIECIFTSEINEENLSVQAKTGLFRIAQELLVNVLNHSGASLVKVLLAENGDNIHLRVTDNGRGFETSEKRDTLGLMGLRERAISLKGILNIDSKPGHGTSVLTTIPKISNYENLNS